MKGATEIDRLERMIKALQVECERFFNGALPTPPDEMREKVQRELRRLREVPVLRTSSRFRLSQLEARLNSQNELFFRRLREKEEGSRATPAAPAEPLFDPWDGVAVGANPSDQQVEAIYAALCRGNGRPPRFDLDSFGTFLVRQVETLREKTGCQQVRFRLVEEDGQRKLKAKPLTSA